MEFKQACLDEVFKSVAGQYPEQTALIFKDQRYTFAELDNLVQQIAALLHKKGVKKGERAIIYLPHMPAWVGAWLALQRLGAVAVPVTHFYGFEELAYIARDCAAGTIFCAASNFEQVLKASQQAPPQRVVVLGAGESSLAMPQELQETELLFLEDELARGQLPSFPAPGCVPTEMAELLYTGGTTGFPKGVPLTHVLLLTAMEVKRSEFASVVPRGQGVSLQGAPLNHILGQELGLGSILAGDALVLLPKMDLQEIFAQIQEHKVTTFFGTPTLCRMILEHEQVDAYDFSSLKYVFTAGEALPDEVAKNWRKRFNHLLYNGYGSTETCGGITGTPVGVPYPEGTCGKVVPTKRIKLLNPDTLEPVTAVNEPGELLVASDQMVTAYWNKPEETALHFVELEGQIWYKTGDIVRIDADGWVFFVDRSVNMIKHKGYRVAAVKVEGVLYKHPAVFECCVIGIPDAKVGERIKGFVVLKAGMEQTTPEELIGWCAAHLASYEVPAAIEIRDSLPKSAVGKILRRIVRDEEREKMKSSGQAG